MIGAMEVHKNTRKMAKPAGRGFSFDGTPLLRMELASMVKVQSSEDLTPQPTLLTACRQRMPAACEFESALACGGDAPGDHAVMSAIKVGRFDIWQYTGRLVPQCCAQKFNGY